MPEQEQDKEQPSPVDKRSSTGGKHHDSVEDLRRSTEEARKKADEAVGLSLKAQLEEEKKKAETYLANWQRAAADFQNYKRRTEQEREELGRLANAALVINILPILDDLERALTSVDARLAGLTWIDGIRLIYRKFQAVLEASGVREIKAEGEDFDPRFHEAVMYGEGEEGKVISEVQRGYMLGDRVIRPSAVVIGRGPKTEGEEKTEDREG
jgi:molecular chaperone GrpE